MASTSASNSSSSNIEVLLENKREYLAHLNDILVEPFVNEMLLIYNTVIDSPRVLKDFQNLLVTLSSMNNYQIRELYNRIIEKNGYSYFPDLLKAIITTIIRINMMLNDDYNDKMKVKVKIPSPDNFIHTCLISVARSIWKKPYILYHEVRSIERQHNINQLEKIIKASILHAIRSSLPLDKMLMSNAGADADDGIEDAESAEDSEADDEDAGEEEEDDDEEEEDEDDDGEEEEEEDEDDDGEEEEEDEEDDDVEEEDGDDDEEEDDGEEEEEEEEDEDDEDGDEDDEEDEGDGNDEAEEADGDGNAEEAEGQDEGTDEAAEAETDETVEDGIKDTYTTEDSETTEAEANSDLPPPASSIIEPAVVITESDQENVATNKNEVEKKLSPPKEDEALPAVSEVNKSPEKVATKIEDKLEIVKLSDEEVVKAVTVPEAKDAAEVATLAAETVVVPQAAEDPERKEIIVSDMDLDVGAGDRERERHRKHKKKHASAHATTPKIANAFY